jgi:hypothetical protein
LLLALHAADENQQVKALPPRHPRNLQS